MWFIYLDMSSENNNHFQIDRNPACGSTLNCFPASCTTNCDYMVTWHVASETEVEFSLQRKTSSNNYYIAAGLSEDLQMVLGYITGTQLD